MRHATWARWRTLAEVRNRLIRICGGSNVEHFTEVSSQASEEAVHMSREPRLRASLIAIMWLLYEYYSLLENIVHRV